MTLDGQSGKTEVSVVIVNWNTCDLLDNVLSSLFAVDHGCKFEVIVVDNGSRDGSAELVRTHWPAVILIALRKNVGFAAANNLGSKRASGDFLLLLNSDAQCTRTTIRGLMRHIQQRSYRWLCRSSSCERERSTAALRECIPNSLE